MNKAVNYNTVSKGKGSFGKQYRYFVGNSPTKRSSREVVFDQMHLGKAARSTSRKPTRCHFGRP